MRKRQYGYPKTIKIDTPQTAFSKVNN